MAHTGARTAALLVGAVALAAAGALWLGGGTAHANCPASDPNCMGDGGGMGGGSDGGSGCNCGGDTTPPATQAPTRTVTNSQSSSGPEVNVVTPEPAPQPKPRVVYTPKPKPAQPSVSGSDFLPAVPDTAPPAPPTPGPAVALDGVDAPLPGAGTALIAGLPPAPSSSGDSSPLLPGLLLLGGVALLSAPLLAKSPNASGAPSATAAAPPPPPPPPPPSPPQAPATPTDFYVYRSPTDNHYAVAKLGEGGVVGAGMTKIYGPDTYASCWAFVAANAVDQGPYFHAAPPPAS